MAVMVVSELDALCDKFEGCETLAFADLSTQMILVTDSHANLPREVLDALCAEAAMVLGVKGKPVLGDRPSGTAVIATKKKTRVFLRALAEPNDALCCICAPHVDFDAFLTEARQSLARILSVDET